MDDEGYLEYLKSSTIDLKVMKYKACPLIGGMLISFLDVKKEHSAYTLDQWKPLLGKMMNTFDNTMYPSDYFLVDDIDELFERLIDAVNIIGDVAMIVVAKSVIAKEIAHQQLQRIKEIVNLEHTVKIK